MYKIICRIASIVFRFNKVSVSKNYDVIVLTKQLFEQSYKIALNHKKDQNQKENSFLRDY